MPLTRWSMYAVFAAAVLLFLGVRTLAPHAQIVGDGVGYHFWTHGLITGNLDFCSYGGLLKDVGAFAVDGNGNCQIKYPPGLAVLRFPVMYWFVDPHTSTAISYGEHQASSYLGALALALTIFFLSMILHGQGVRPRRAQFVVLSGVLGLGMYHYAIIENSMSHIYSAMFLSGLAWIGERLWRLRPGLPDALAPTHAALLPLLAFVFAFFVIQLRNVNVFLVALLLAFFGLAFLRSRRGLFAALAGGVGVLAGIVVQLSYNAYIKGGFALSSYEGSGGFLWDRPMMWSVLFSYSTGIFPYYLVLAVMMIVALSYGRSRPLALIMLVVVLFYAALYGYWEQWDLGHSFGHRGFVELFPPVIIAFGLAAEEMDDLPWQAVVLVCTVVVLATINAMFAYYFGQLPHQYATGAEFRSAVFAFGNIPAWAYTQHVAWLLVAALALRKSA